LNRFSGRLKSAQPFDVPDAHLQAGHFDQRRRDNMLISINCPPL
jgi:hypothetical protein